MLQHGPCLKLTQLLPSFLHRSLQNHLLHPLRASQRLARTYRREAVLRPYNSLT